MNKLILGAIAITYFTFSSCGYQRIGDLTMISNRNIDSSKEYVLLERNVEAKAKVKKGDALERAVDQATEVYQGEYLMNAKVYLKRNGKRIKVIGDVYGIRATSLELESEAIKSISYETGDTVSFKLEDKLQEGLIIGFNQNKVLVEYLDRFRMRTVELNYDQVTKIFR